ncbi:FCD domain-containing protein [Polycladidibacter stylochi]|uniref:FCD domain-containing protein n=1 Tax=Polycladidibacter stylochi TaxID=1807766 RepID=UPI00082A3320|nr:FCD domain-containing protein [Pseudovibrio stylochi]
MSNSEQRRRYQDVAALLRQEIASGKYELGTRMRPERQIAEEMEVSRSLVREAMIMLEIEGLVDVRKGSGSYVIALPSNEQTNNPTADIGPFELLQARQLLESNVAGFAATTITKADVVRLRTALDQEKQDLAAGIDNYDADEQFHILIAKATQNTVLADMVQTLWNLRKNSHMWNKLHERIFDDTYRQAWLQDHENILNALQRRDPAAARQAMWQHLDNVRKRLLTLSDSEDPAFDAYLFHQDPVVA